MDNRKPARSGAARQAAYRARLAASGEPPVDVVAAAFMMVTVSASLHGEDLSPATIIERAAAIVTADPRFTQEGIDNVLSRVAQPVNREVSTHEDRERPNDGYAWHMVSTLTAKEELAKKLEDGPVLGGIFFRHSAQRVGGGKFFAGTVAEQPVPAARSGARSAPGYCRGKKMRWIQFN